MKFFWYGLLIWPAPSPVCLVFAISENKGCQSKFRPTLELASFGKSCGIQRLFLTKQPILQDVWPCKIVTCIAGSYKTCYSTANTDPKSIGWVSLIKLTHYRSPWCVVGFTCQVSSRLWWPCIVSSVLVQCILGAQRHLSERFSSPGEPHALAWGPSYFHSLQTKIWKKLAGPKHNFAKIYIWWRRRACWTDPNFAGQGLRSSTYFEDCFHTKVFQVKRARLKINDKIADSL